MTDGSASNGPSRTLPRSSARWARSRFPGPADDRRRSHDMNAQATDTAPVLPDYAPIPPSAFGPAPNAQGYYVGRIERNLHWVTDGVYQAAFLTTTDGVVLV